MTKNRRYVLGTVTPSLYCFLGDTVVKSYLLYFLGKSREKSLHLSPYCIRIERIDKVIPKNRISLVIGRNDHKAPRRIVEHIKRREQTVESKLLSVIYKLRRSHHTPESFIEEIGREPLRIFSAHRLGKR